MLLSQWVAQHEGVVGLVATDIVGSTSLLFEARTIRYSDMLRKHHARALERATRCDGRIIDHAGDGIFAAFPDALLAFRFGRELFADSGHPKLKIRVGVHVGPVQAEEGALIGRSVHVCARIMQRGGEEPQLWISDPVRRALDASSDGDPAKLAWIEEHHATLKGIPELHRLWRAA